MKDWYSCRLKIVCLIEGSGADRYMCPVHLFRAANFDEAFAIALELGRNHEREYANGDGQRVRWRLVAVDTLDMIRRGDLDRAEIYSEFVALGPNEQHDFDATFRPRNSEPSQSL